MSIRGFRPEFSGITKHSLLLIDGRPAGATNLATVLMDNVERIEILKGPASSIYGAEAMGGVINIITKKSTGRLAGKAEVGGGSFDTFAAKGAIGGKITNWMDFDITARTYNQNDNIELGNDHGERPGTSYDTNYGSLRLGSAFMPGWRLDVKGDWYYGNDIETPGALFYDDRQQSQKDVERYSGDMHLSGEWGKNRTNFTMFSSKETSDYYKKYEYDYTSGGYVPTSKYHSYYKETEWWGMQLQNTYKFGRHGLTAGIDYQDVDVESRSYKRDGSRRAPWSPDSSRENWAVFGNTLWKFLDDRLTITAGIRYDYFDVETKRTPYKTDFHPGSEEFDTVSPRAGIKFRINDFLDLHTTLGKAFVPPTAAQMAGYSERMVQDTVMITKGNPDLDPETSWTWDGGIGVHHATYGIDGDLTFYVTEVNDKITRKTVGNITTYTNSADASIAGMEFKLGWNVGKFLDLGRNVKLFVNGERIFHSREDIPGQGESDIHNVAHWKVNYGIDYEDGIFNGRLLARYVGKRKDSDWYSPGYPVITYDSFTVVDLALGLNITDNHHLTLKINNIFDEYYFEKPEFPLAGRAWYLSYQYTF